MNNNNMKNIFCCFFITICLIFALTRYVTAEDNIFQAAKEGNTILLETFFLDQQEDVNQQDLLGNTPLIYACSTAKEDTVKFLLKKKANPNISNNEGITPLIAAC